jgi:hypothetical protein
MTLNERIVGHLTDLGLYALSLSFGFFLLSFITLRICRRRGEHCQARFSPFLTAILAGLTFCPIPLFADSFWRSGSFWNPALWLFAISVTVPFSYVWGIMLILHLRDSVRPHDLIKRQYLYAAIPVTVALECVFLWEMSHQPSI